jgi:hypothetical protein
VICVELGKDNHGLITAIPIGRRLKPLDARIDHQTRFNSVVKEKKKFYKQIR